MNAQMRSLMFTVLGIAMLMFPLTAYSMGHSPTGESRTIFEAYEMACDTALHEVFKHSVLSHIRVIPSGIVVEIFFPESTDLPYAVAEAMVIWDLAKDAHRLQSAGHVVHVRATWLAQHFRDMRQGVCDQRRSQR